MAQLNEVQNLRSALDAQGKKLVLTNGCFDLLHVGHVRYLNEARALGDALVVAVNSDRSVRELKGEGRPLTLEAERVEILEALKSVDVAVVFDELRATKIIEEIQPHIYAKGGDYSVDSLNVEEREALERCDSQIEILSLVPGKSTSETLKAMGDSEARASTGKMKLGVLGSGRGSNFDAIAEAIDRGDLDAEVTIVISDVSSAPILEKARSRGIPCLFIDPGPFKTKLGTPAQKEISDRLRAAGVDLVALAGFMRLVKEPLLADFEGRIINIHPSLLPKFKGLEAWKQALEAGEKETGCTVHFVTEEMDAGKILGQEKVPIVAGDTPESVHAKIQEKEHMLYPAVIQQFAESWKAK
ncbi:MAG: phosphoribosylglycinamide formyltransferase [Verrucomicrobiota bacterium]